MKHSIYGYSATSQFERCPYNYKLSYIDHLETIPDDDPANALYIGTALHKAIETDFETAAKEYYAQFPVITDRHITEMMKVEIQAKKVKDLIESSGNPLLHETFIRSGEFMGTIDLLEDLGDGYFNMYDFKYTNSVDAYRDSPQLTLYKYFYDLTHKGFIDRMFFIIVPKSSLKQKENETLQEYRRRLIADLKDPVMIESEFSSNKLQDYFKTVEEIKKTKVFPKKQNQFCFWCKYKDYCERGNDFMILPSTERRQVATPTRRKIWIYGATMSGKTTLVDSAPNPLNLNTDGNIQFVSMPYVAIKDEVQVEGRITKKTLAWDVFKDTIAELEKKQNDFKTIVVDLIEDTYESCRLYMYDKLGITHESDDSFRAWDKVRTEFLSTIRRLMNLDYENIVLISHEDTSKDIMKKSGDKITSIKPNINDKVANKIAGMVDIVARVVVEDDGSRTLNFKSNEVVFGGGRLKGLETTQIALEWTELMKVYNCKTTSEKRKETALEKAQEEDIKADIQKAIDEAGEEPKTSRRRGRTKVEKTSTDEGFVDAEELPFDNKLTETTYYKTADGNFIMKNVGDLPLNNATVISKEEFDAGVKSYAQQTEEAPKRRTRRTRS